MITFTPTGGEKDGMISIGTNYIGATGKITLKRTGILSTDEYTLTINMDGSGTGSVMNGEDMLCTESCSVVFPAETELHLTAEADIGSSFDGWSTELCRGTDTCAITMNNDIEITAAFTLDEAPTGDPEPEILINGFRRNVDMVINVHGDLEVAVTLDPGFAQDKYADLWVIYEGPYGWYSFDMEYDDISSEWSGLWKDDFYPSWQGMLFPIDTPLIVLSNTIDGTHPEGLHIGEYIFYFMVDLIMNGMMDDSDGSGVFFMDSVVVDVVN